MPDASPPNRLNIAGAITALLLFQLAGEAVVLGARLAIPSLSFPGPVAGMVFLFVWLVARKGPGPALEATSSGILTNLSLLFVPAAVGIIQYGDVLASFGFALVAALLASTVLTLVVTVYVFMTFSRPAKEGTSDAL